MPHAFRPSSETAQPPSAQSRSLPQASPGSARDVQLPATQRCPGAQLVPLHGSPSLPGPRAAQRPSWHRWSRPQLTLARHVAPGSGRASQRCVTSEHWSAHDGFRASRWRSERYVASGSIPTPHAAEIGCGCRHTPGLEAPCPSQCSTPSQSSDDRQPPPSATSPTTTPRHSTGGDARVGATQSHPAICRFTAASQRAVAFTSTRTLPLFSAADR